MGYLKKAPGRRERLDKTSTCSGSLREGKHAAVCAWRVQYRAIPVHNKVVALLSSRFVDGSEKATERIRKSAVVEGKRSKERERAAG